MKACVRRRTRCVSRTEYTAYNELVNPSLPPPPYPRCSLGPARYVFPEVTEADASGLLAVGGDLEPETLLEAYCQGIFPWPHEGVPYLLWFAPPQRAVLDFADLHVPRRLTRLRRAADLTFTIDRAFDDVIAACRRADRPGQSGTWILPEMEAAYCRLHRLGIAHSVEAWNPAGQLAGGLYGVDAGGLFSGESMFHREPNASKLALLFLVDHLQGQGVDFLDIQQLTPHLAALGAREIPRATFQRRLHGALISGRCLF